MMKRMKDIIKLLFSVLMLTGTLFSPVIRTVEAATTQVIWNSSDWEGGTEIFETSFSSKGVTITVDGLATFRGSSRADIISMEGTFTFTADEGYFTSITIISDDSINVCPQGWTSVDIDSGDSFIWTGKEAEVTLSNQPDIFAISEIQFTMSKDPDPDIVLTVTPPKCGTTIEEYSQNGTPWYPRPEVEYLGNKCKLISCYYAGNDTPRYSGTYKAGDDFYIEIEFEFSDPKFTGREDFTVEVNEGISVLKNWVVVDETDDGGKTVLMVLKGTVPSDCDVEPDPTPTPDPDPTPVPDPTPAPFETPVAIPKTGIE